MRDTSTTNNMGSKNSTHSHSVNHQEFYQSSKTMEQIRSNFPILTQTVHQQPLVYLDNAATTQKPMQVIEALNNYYQTTNSNVHRGVHYLSEQATAEYDAAREKVRAFINAHSTQECIFTKGATESINLVAFAFGEKYINAGDEIIISQIEHHANIVPWQLLCKRKQATLKYIPLQANGELDLTTLDKLITEKTKLIAINHVSNAIGTINPVKQVISQAHKFNIPVLIDGAQAPAHLKVDVTDLDCDFYAFSGHKMYGPMGIGVLYGKEKWLELLPPYQSGGDMILKVSLTAEPIFSQLPTKFEAGTPNVASAIALGATIDFLASIDLESLWKNEQKLLQYATEKLSNLPGINIIGTATNKVSVLSFTLDKIHPHDIGTILDQAGIAVRSGHHCTMPLMDFFAISGTTRASFGIYNTKEEVDKLIAAILKVKEILTKK